MGGRTFRPFGRGSVALFDAADARPDAGCFADEVAIDFPSVAPAVEVLATELRLSMVEARRGLVVPLDVPMRGTCSRCGGRGETWTEPCLRCQGSGTELRHHQLQVAVPAGVLDGTCFRFTVTPRHNPSTRVELRVLVA